MRIGMFDSGIGGLTVLKKLAHKYPNNEYIYFGDTLNNPYGNKTIEELKNLSTNIIDFLLTKKVDLIIIACGTISSNLSNYLKDNYNIPIIDIISPTIEYLNNSHFNKIGVIATEATINSKIFSTNINKEIKEVACPMFVPLIENNNLDEIDNYINEYLKELKDKEVIVLGCTHYPIIKENINKYFHKKIKLLDMSDCLTLSNLIESNKKIELYFSEINNRLENNIKKIIEDENIDIYEKVILD